MNDSAIIDKAKIPPHGFFHRDKSGLTARLGELQKGGELVLEGIKDLSREAAKAHQSAKTLGIKVKTRSEPPDKLHVHRVK